MTHWPQFSHLKTQTTQQHHVLISRVMFETLFRHVHCYGDQVFLQLHLYFDSSLSQGYQHKAYSSAKFHSLKKGYSPNFIHKRSVYSSWGAQNKPLKTRFWLTQSSLGRIGRTDISADVGIQAFFAVIYCFILSFCSRRKSKQ